MLHAGDMWWLLCTHEVKCEYIITLEGKENIHIDLPWSLLLVCLSWLLLA